jgi:hypothetical protein
MCSSCTPDAGLTWHQYAMPVMLCALMSPSGLMGWRNVGVVGASWLGLGSGRGWVGEWKGNKGAWPFYQTSATLCKKCCALAKQVCGVSR